MTKHKNKNEEKEKEEEHTEGSTLSMELVEMEEATDTVGLSTILKGSTSKSAPIGSIKLESFLKEVETAMTDKVEHDYEDSEKRPKEALLLNKSLKKKGKQNSDINLRTKLLKQSAKVTISNDKINSFKIGRTSGMHRMDRGSYSEEDITYDKREDLWKSCGSTEKYGKQHQ